MQGIISLLHPNDQMITNKLIDHNHSEMCRSHIAPI